MGALAGLYKTALTGLLGGQALVFDYDANFKELWEDDDSGQPTILTKLQNEKKDQVVIVWDACPKNPDDKHFSNEQLMQHLTPLDWALAFSIKLLREHKSLRGIRIVDLTGVAHHTWAMSLRHTLLAEMPWVTLHAPLIPSSRRGYRCGYQSITNTLPAQGSCQNGLLLQKAGQDGFQLAELNEPMNPEATLRLENLARQWAASLVQGTDRHNINNLVGPVILSKLLGLKAALAEDPFLDAFVQKLNWTNVVSGIKEKHLDPPQQIENSLAAAGIEKMRVLVIDDELDRGWDAVVCGLLSKKLGDKRASRDQFTRLDCDNQKDSPIEIWGCSTPNQLLETLWGKPERFFERDLNSPLFKQSKPIRAEFLILDLRLFREVGSQDSRNYIRGLVGKARDWSLSNKENLAWPPIEKKELDRIEAWLDASRPIDPTVESSAITLLPRILALAAPLTPIMLFSATGRADIKQKLKPYRNILTGFSKPQALQDFASIKESIAEFDSGLKDGIRMLGMHLRLAKCMEAAASADEARKNYPKRANGHIDFYFDESGESDMLGFVSASAATVFSCCDAADNLQTFLQNQAINGKGDLPVWNARYRKEGDGRNPLKKYSQLRDAAAKTKSVNILNEAIENSEAAAIRNAWTSLCVKRSAEDEPLPNSKNIQWIDSHLDLMLNFSVQFNFCVLPRFLGFEQVTCGLYFDQRSVPPTKIRYDDHTQWNPAAYEEEKTSARKLSEQFGCDTTTKDLTDDDLRNNRQAPKTIVLVTTYPKSAYYPFVREALVGWAPQWNNGTSFKVVRGQQLSECSAGYNRDYTSPKCGEKDFNMRRWLHDVADWVAGACKNNSADFLKKIFPNQLTTTLDVGLASCLRAARSASWARGDECIRALMENPRIYDPKGKLDEVERILIWACRDTLKHACGSSLHVPLNEVETTPTLVTKPVINPWAAFDLYKPPLGYEVLMVASCKTIERKKYWILKNRGDDEVAVARVCYEDRNINRTDQIGLFKIQTKQVTSTDDTSYSVFTLDYWFEMARTSQSGNTKLEAKPVGVAAGVAEGPAGTLRQAADWRDLVDVCEGAIEATVVRTERNGAVVFRSCNTNDNRVYRSQETGLPQLPGGVRVVIRPNTERSDGYVICALVAWHSPETCLWTRFELDTLLQIEPRY